MSAIELFWIASVLGAALFFGSGFLSGRLRGPATDTAFEEADSSAAANDSVAIRRQLAEAAAQLEQAVARGAQLERALADAQAARPSRGATVPAPPTPAAGTAQLSSDFAVAAAKVTELERSLQVERDAQLALQRRVDEAERAQASLVDRKQLDEAETRARAAETRSAAAESRLKELTKVATELTDLRRRHNELLARVGGSDATGELKRSERSGENTVIATPAPRLALDGREETVESLLSKQLSRFARDQASEATVLSDDQGLVLGGTGREVTQEHLAVLASLARAVVDRAQEFVGINDVATLELASKTGKGVRFRFFDFGGDVISLGCLGRHEFRGNPAEESVIAAFPRALMGA